jgi:hypothetical protein
MLPDDVVSGSRCFRTTLSPEADVSGRHSFRKSCDFLLNHAAMSPGTHGFCKDTHKNNRFPEGMSSGSIGFRRQCRPETSASGDNVVRKHRLPETLSSGSNVVRKHVQDCTSPDVRRVPGHGLRASGPTSESWRALAQH